MLLLILVTGWFAWPLGDVLPDTLPAGVDYERLNVILDEAVDKPGEEPFKKTLGLAVVYRNSLIGVNYLEHEPGTHWNYSSGDANLLSGLLRLAIGDEEEYLGYAYTRLFHRTGMLNTVVETDASNLFVASSYSYGSTRDWARFGLLFLNKGIFAGDTVLSPEWVAYMHTPAPASEGNYAATFWLEEPSPVAPSSCSGDHTPYS